MQWFDSDLLQKSNLTNAQAMLWTGFKMNPNDPIYNIIFTFRIHGEIDLEIFSKSIDELVNRSDTLRTVFEEEGEIPYQKVLDTVNYELGYHDLSQNDDGEKVLEDFIDSKKNHIYDLSKCLFELSLLKINQSEFVFLFNQHHLITDAWGHFVLFSKLNDIYSSLLEGESLGSVEIPHFQDYINFEKISRDRVIETRLNYWKEKSKNIEPIQLYGSENILDTSAKRVTLQLGKKRTSLIKKLVETSHYKSFNQDLSMYQLFCSSIFLYLYKVSNQHNLSFGTPTHNRVTPKFKDSPGLFIEFFPMQISIDEEETLQSLHQKVVHETLEFLQHVRPGNSVPEINRKFNVVFNYVNASVPLFASNKVVSTYEFSGHNDPRHSLIIQAHDYDRAGNITVQVDYKTNQFSPLLQEFVPEEFMNCVDAFLKDEGGLLDEIEIVGPNEKSYLLEMLNDTEDKFDENEILLTKFYQQESKNSSQIAFQFQEENISYAELDQLSDLFAQELHNNYSVRKGDIIAIYMDRSIDMGIAIYSILKSGAAYLPIDTKFPKDRVKYLLTDSDVKVVVTSSHLAQSLPEETTHSIADSLKGKLRSIDHHQFEKPDIEPKDIACILYTSGSTGNPKGIKLTHQGLCNNLNWLQNTYPMGPEDAILQKTPLIFDVSIWEFFWPLQVGARLVIIPPDKHTDPYYLISEIKNHNVHSIHFVPSMLLEFLKTPGAELCKSLRYVMSGGEALTPAIRDQFFEKLNCRLDQQYAPTETAVGVASWECSKQGYVRKLPIGGPVSNSRFFVLDQFKNVVPLGVPGELYIGGSQVSPGYLNKDELTNERFIELDAIDSKGKLYRTGDWVRYNTKGELEFIGRQDDQANVNGIRIELGEVESKIRAIDGVDDTSVIVDYVKGNQILVCIVKSKKESIIGNIQSQLFGILPSYMVPSVFMKVEEFPLLANGKLDRKAIQEFYRERDDHLLLDEGRRYSPPTNDLEEIVQGVWNEVFNQSRISIYDRFLELGGNSLMAIRMISRLRNELDLELPVTLTFEHPTIASMAAFIEELMVKLLEKEDQ